MLFRPNPAFHPKNISSYFQLSDIALMAFQTPPEPSESEVRLHLLCLVRASKSKQQCEPCVIVMLPRAALSAVFKSLVMRGCLLSLQSARLRATTVF
jgi:hypothetical protein